MAKKAVKVQPEEIELVINPPDRNTPGFLRRLLQVAEFQTVFKGGDITLSSMKSLVEFLLDYVDQPKDREVAREILLDCTEEQFGVILERIGKAGEDVNPQNSAQLETG